MIENVYDFATGLQDGWKTRHGWGHPRGHGTRRTRPFYWDAFRAAHDGPPITD